MRRWAGWIVIGWALALGAVALMAYGSPPSHLSLDDRVRAVGGDLRCLVCQGESIADSPSDFAHSVRRNIRAQLLAGKTTAQVENFFVSRYGDRILLSPPASGIGSIAWLAPPLLVLGGAALLLTLVADWRRTGRRQVTAKSVYLERVRAELHGFDE